EFLPEFHETNFVMHMTGAPGVGFTESVRVGSEVGRRLLAVPGVRSVAQVIGRSTLSEDVWGPERSEMMVQLAPDVDAEAVTEALREEAAGVAGFAFDAAADPERFARLPLVTSEGRIVPLGAVADVEIAALRTAIMHEDGVRTILVRLDARGRALDAVARDVGRAVAATALPPGVYAEVGGEYAAAAAARQRLVGLGALALLGIFILLLLDFRSARLAALTMVNVPLAFVGGLAAVLLAGGGQLAL